MAQPTSELTNKHKPKFVSQTEECPKNRRRRWTHRVASQSLFVCLSEKERERKKNDHLKHFWGCFKAKGKPN